MGDEDDAQIALPACAYVPGRTTRHPEDLFDEIKETASGTIPPGALHKTPAFRAGLKFLEHGYYWECHEVLEAVWLQTPDPSPEREMVLAVIQLANARLKLRMGKTNAARRLCDKVEGHLRRCDGPGPILGLTRAVVMDWVAETRMDFSSKNVKYNAKQ